MANSTAKIALICGLALEQKTAEAAIARKQAERLLVYNAGMGAGRAREMVDAAASAGAAGIISYGVCGGLDPGLVAGDIVMPKTILSENDSVQVDEAWHARLVDILSAQYEPRIMPLYTAGKVVASIPEKADLFEKIGAGAVDMESAVIAGLAHQAGLPFITVRVVHDPAGQSIPPAFAQIIDENGKPNVLALIKALIFHWPGVKVLQGLADAAAQARTNLDGLTSFALPDFGFTG